MAKKRMAKSEPLGKVVMEGQEDALRELVCQVVHEVMAEESAGAVGAGPYERSEERQGYRNGTRSRQWNTRVGTIELAVPRVRGGVGYFPSFLEYRRRSERALMATLVEMVLKGVSHRRAEDVLRVMGVKEISPSQVSRFLGRLDEHVEAFRKARIDGEFPYVYLDAKYEKAREKGLPKSQAVLIAIGVRSDGHRRVLGVEIWPDETGPGWKAFLEGLVKRGLTGVQLVISDAHLGLREAIPQVFVGAAWQRCRVHFMRNILARVHRSRQPVVAALVRTVFAQGSHGEAVAQLHWAVGQLEAACPEAARTLEMAEGEVLSYMAFPAAHWSHIHSTNVLERLNRELARRTRLVGIFPSTQSLMRYIAALLLEIDDDWQVEERRYLSQESMARLYAKRPSLDAPAA